MTKPPRLFWVGLCVIGALPRLIDLWFFPVALTNRDFSSFYAAGRMVVSGLGSHVYDRAAFLGFSRALYGADYGLPFAYPPHALLFVAPFGALPYALSYALWSVVGLAFFTWAARPYAKWLPLFLPATLLCLEYGQCGLFIGGLWLLAFNRSAPALAFLTIKPHIGALAGALALRDAELLRNTFAWLVGAVILTTALFGFSIWTGFAHAVIAQTGIHPSHSIAALWSYGIAGQIGFALAALALLTRRFDVFTAATAALLISPYTFGYDMPVANLGLAVALCDERPLWQRLVLAGAFLSPALAIFSFAIVPPLLLAALWVQVGAHQPEFAAGMWRRIHRVLFFELGKCRHCGRRVGATESECDECYSQMQW